MRLLPPAAALAATLLTSAAAAQDVAVDQHVSAGGSCPVLRIGTMSESCNRVSYMVANNGRVMFTVLSPKGPALGFVGEKPTEPDKTTRVLKVEAVYLGQSQGAAAGSCTLKSSEDGAYFRALDCDVEAGGRPIRLRFQGDGRKVVVHKGEEAKKP